MLARLARFPYVAVWPRSVAVEQEDMNFILSEAKDLLSHSERAKVRRHARTAREVSVRRSVAQVCRCGTRGYEFYPERSEGSLVTQRAREGETPCSHASRGFRTSQ